jgi:hypothetical protein
MLASYQKITKRLPLIVVILIVMGACQQKVDNNATKNTSVSIDNNTNSTGNSTTEIPKAEMGITVVSETGWTEKEMEFQQSYCESMMASLEDIEGYRFCECFLSKIQYYYKPIHFKEAYQDQKKWNEICYQEAMK